jgi:hypothetical protein
MKAEREESLAWDRFGRFLQQSGSRSSDIADRNLQLWSSVSGHLKKDQYTADDMADDIARSISTAIDNMSDVWSMFTNDPAQNALAQPIPTAFLLFDWAGTSRHRLLEPVRIEVGSLSNRGALPQQARVELSGSRAPWSDEEKEADRRGVAIPGTQDGVQRLRERVVAYRDENARAYILADVSRILETPRTYNVDTGTSGSGGKSDSWFIEKPLVPGVYDGIVYLTDPPALLASVRIVVEGAPPAPPIVSEESGQPPPESKTI